MAQQKVTPFLWFQRDAEEAARFYVSVIPDSAIESVARNPDGTAMVVTFRLGGTVYHAFNGGTYFQLNEAISLVVDCATQEEVDFYWERLSEGGSTNVCGWLKDRFGLSWQVTPRVLMELMADADREKAGRVFRAMQGMAKLEIRGLLDAAAAASGA